MVTTPPPLCLSECSGLNLGSLVAALNRICRLLGLGYHGVIKSIYRCRIKNKLEYQCLLVYYLWSELLRFL